MEITHFHVLTFPWRIQIRKKKIGSPTRKFRFFANRFGIGEYSTQSIERAWLQTPATVSVRFYAESKH